MVIPHSSQLSCCFFGRQKETQLNQNFISPCEPHSFIFEVVKFFTRTFPFQ